ncbi:MAG: 50S ribosomal protein L5 [Candidatus Marinimicrobia bacterium]|jgi:large subunit ribosomal protein L5|nr:50S ribosomal protein L5 [Candidatus Neomarinimicrobiota bacterium]MBT3496673.1 50S ribosomal protein L5 [Candidatus Neomarinimicrobiota bacterium]MBT3692977.1 50S ribosomal protein L5 [Candidatus Neomarinimicrobiota bacterium]MBT3731954.1 50S ribosomal protein L5 [Candidatus Neomarinimicrobiota bacterium]MBT4144025.1 50S ribosomal protein L5 [Candidatus Neomarinimicrobiota bacterium]
MAEEKKKSTAKKKAVSKKKAPVKKAAPKKDDKKTVAKKKSAVKAKAYAPKLRTLYKDSIISSLIKRFGYKNVMQVPKLLSVSLNMGIGDAKTNSKHLESAIDEMALISGQKPVITKSKKDVSNFKIRQGYPVGCKVTLRSAQMYEFLERLIAVALPRSRDFRGLSWKSFDGRGNYNFGIKEQIIFTEIDYDKIQEINGMNVTITTTAKTNDEAYWLLKEFGFPLRDKPVKKDIEEAA